MKNFLIRLLLQLAVWLGWEPVLPCRRTHLTIPNGELAKRALVLVREQSGVEAGGEYKRHVVYAALQREFPSLPHRDLSLAIEEALSRV